MFAFRRLERTTREISPEGSRSFTRTEVERAQEWSLMSDGQTLVVARWSPSNYAYIGTNLLPIAGTKTDSFTHAMPLGIRSITEIPRFLAENEIIP